MIFLQQKVIYFWLGVSCITFAFNMQNLLTTNLSNIGMKMFKTFNSNINLVGDMSTNGGQELLWDWGIYNLHRDKHYKGLFFITYSKFFFLFFDQWTSFNCKIDFIVIIDFTIVINITDITIVVDFKVK